MSGRLSAGPSTPSAHVPTSGARRLRRPIPSGGRRRSRSRCRRAPRRTGRGRRAPIAGVSSSPPAIEAPIAMPTAVSATMTTIATSAPMPSSTTQRTRGEACRQQHLGATRRLVEAQPSDERRRGQAGEDHAELDEHELEEAAHRREVDAREDGVQQLHEVRRFVQLRDPRAAGRRRRRGRTARRRCPTRVAEVDVSWPRARPVRDRPSRARGRDGVGMALVAPRSRRANASTPMPRR